MNAVEHPAAAPEPKMPAVRVKSTFDPGLAEGLSFLLLACAVGFTWFVSSGDGFTPRVATIDALAGLVVGAFAVDRLLTFIPAKPADDDPEKRARDIDSLRWGWGAALGAAFVWLTGLEAVAALTGTTEPIDPRVDRVIAVLAIAGGVKGLARFKEAVNPPAKTKGDMDPASAAGAIEEQEPVQPPPGTGGYLIGWGAIVAAFVIAALFAGDDSGLELLGLEEQADGTMALIVRFGPVLVAAVVVEQLVERSFASSLTGPDKKLLTASAAVLLGVIAARLMDLYLMHAIGFFETGAGGLDAALGASTSTERALDVVVTGLVIASGTTALHDIAASLKRAKDA